jgi:hypothetical protein
MKKRLVFKRSMMQRYRAIANIADDLVNRGYELFVEVQSNEFDLNEIRKHPMDASRASKKSFVYLLNNFGIQCDNLDDIVFTTEKNKIDGLFLLVDDKTNSKKYISIPYNGFYCMDGKDKVLVGNPMCEMIKKSQSKNKEQKNTLLLIHPGGGRGYISPVRQPLSKAKTIKNNIRFLRKILRNLPNTIKKVTIKTHPVPYLCCDYKAMQKKVMNILRDEFSDIEINLVFDNFILHVAEHEYILNIGSTSAIWLLGSDKKWINLFGLAKYDYKKHRDIRPRADKWFKWPQNIKLKYLHDFVLDYNSRIELDKETSDIREKNKEIYNMDATQNIIDFIDHRS